MAVTHPTDVRNTVCDTVVDLLDAGTPPGKLIFQTSSSSNVATLTLATNAFGTSSNALATANAIVADTNAVGGTISKAVLNNAAGSNKILCSVTVSGGGGDIILNSVTVSAGQEVSVSSLTYTSMA